MKKYFLDFDPFDLDQFCLKTVEEHDVVYSGHISDIIEEDEPDWTGAFDAFFEKELGIKSEEWEVG